MNTWLSILDAILFGLLSYPFKLWAAAKEERLAFDKAPHKIQYSLPALHIMRWLIKAAKRKVFLTLNNLRGHHAKAVKA